MVQNARVTDPAPELDRRKIGIGLAMISLVMVVALVLASVIDSTVGRAVMFGIAAVAFVRLFLLTRSLRSSG